jgi:hypothetical protein
MRSNKTHVLAAAIAVLVSTLLSSSLHGQDQACKYGPTSRCLPHTTQCYPGPPVCAGPLDVSTPATLNVATQELQSKIDATKQQCTQDLTAAETRINNNLKTSLDKMPQRLLSEEARKSIENALREEFKAQLDQLRKDLQDQINSLKKQ